MIIECIELNWLCKHMKKIRSSQAPISVLNWVKHNFSLWVSLIGLEFAKSRAMHARRARRAHVPKCQRAKSVSISHFYVPTCQWTCQRAKGVPIIQLDVSTFFIMLNICKFLEYLGNCRKFISRNKEFKFSHLQNINQKPLISFSMEHVGLTEQLFS